MSLDSRTSFRHPKVIGVSLVVGPLLMLGGDAIALWGGQELGLWSGVLLFLSAYCFVGVVLGLHTLAEDRIGALAGALLALFGCFMAASMSGFDRAAWSMWRHGIPSDSIQEVTAEPAVFLLTRPPGITFPIGLILLTIYVIKAGHLTRLQGALLILGVVLFPVGRVFAGPVVNVPSDAIMLAVLGALGLRIFRLSP